MAADASGPVGAKSSADFYMDALTEAEKEAFAAALEVDGIDGEIALLRTKLHRAVEKDEAGLALVLRGFDLLVKAVVLKFKLGPGSAEQLEESLRSVLQEAALASGGGTNGG